MHATLSEPVSRGRKTVAWIAHLYTAMGLVIAAAMLVFIFEGTPSAFRRAFWAMLIACFIDATDGTLARVLRVKALLPQFDGARLDDIIDFLTYTFLPLGLIWRAGIVPEGERWVLLIPLLASGYGFSQTMAKTPDGYFLGFPSYWNVVALYLYVLQPAPLLAEAILVALAVLTFVPCPYPYPTQTGRLNRVMLVLVAIWAVLVIRMLSLLPYAARPSMIEDERLRLVTWLSLIVPALYLASSWVMGLRPRKAPRQGDWLHHWD